MVANRSHSERAVRVLYSFPHRLGLGRICNTAWHEIDSATGAGAVMTVIAGDSVRSFVKPVKVSKTFAYGKLKIPYRVLGTRRMCALHDMMVASKLRRMVGAIDVVHAWPLAALETLRVANELGIATVLERPNAHTRFAYDVVQKESARLGIVMPEGHEHAYDADVLRREEAEYTLAARILCPSDFVAKTFRERGFPAERLVRHQYGCDLSMFTPEQGGRPADRPFTVLFAGGCAPRKGLHYALEAWRRARVRTGGRFLIVGEFIPEYRKVLTELLDQPGVEILGYRTDMAEIMRQADVFVLPSIEEGSAIVTHEARASGCVLLVTDEAGAICRDGENAIVHKVADVEALAAQMDRLNENRDLLGRMRAASLGDRAEVSWETAGVRLHEVYREAAQLTVTADTARVEAHAAR